MTVIKCLLSFKKLPIAERPIFATGIKDGIYGNPTIFMAPPITAAIFEGLINNFTAKRGLYENGGSAQQPAWNAANTALIDALVETATYVNTLVNGDENVVILAGYKPSKSHSSEVAKPLKIQGVTLKRDADEVSGTLIADCTAQVGVKTYVCILTEGAPLPSNVKINTAGQLVVESSSPIPTPGSPSPIPQPIQMERTIIDFNQNRRKEFTALTPLMTYYATFFGINGGGVGSMSDAQSVVCL